MTGKKLEPPLYIELDPDEALERFIRADPKEVEKLIKAGKKQKPPPKAATKGGGHLRPKPKRAAARKG